MSQPLINEFVPSASIRLQARVVRPHDLLELGSQGGFARRARAAVHYCLVQLLYSRCQLAPSTLHCGRGLGASSIGGGGGRSLRSGEPRLGLVQLGAPARPL